MGALTKISVQDYRLIFTMKHKLDKRGGVPIPPPFVTLSMPEIIKKGTSYSHDTYRRA